MVCSFFIPKKKGVRKIATTGIWKIEKRLDNVIDYTTNIEKTINSDYGKDSYYDLHNVIDYVEADYKTEKQFYVSGVNCNPKTALEEMTITKEQYGKAGGILGFHAFQSFAEREVTPEQCHAIGVRLAEEMWGDRFEVVVSTHLNTNHYHNHFVINSVSFKDGKRYYDKRETYAELRRLSDSLCEEYGLSVLKEKPCRNSRINFANYQKDNNNKVNYYSIAKNDLDRAIGMATSYYDFEDLMKAMDYELIYRGNDRNIEKVKSLEKEKINIEYQQQRLIDLMIDGTIDKESYNKKKVTFDNKKEKIDKEIEQYRLLTEDEDKVESGIKKIKEVIDSNKLLDGFDRDVFDALVDYIIIGGYENGKKDDCMIRFICKTQFDDTPREDLTKQKIIDNNDIMDYKCNSFINILDFYSNQQFFYFYVDENGKKRKKVINSVRVRVEVEK